MKQHSVPQEIMSVEFNLFGSMNIRQFGYVAGAGGLAYFFYLILPGFLKWVGAVVCILLGLALAFLPNFDKVVMNFLLTLKRPTRRVWKKNPQPPDFLLDIPIKSYRSGHTDEYTGKESGQVGSQVYSRTRARQDILEEATEEVDSELKKMTAELSGKKDSDSEIENEISVGITNDPNLINGQVLDSLGDPVNDALVIVLDSFEKSLLAVKTNTKGLFLSSKPLPLGKYTLVYVKNNKIIDSVPIVVNGAVMPFVSLKDS